MRQPTNQDTRLADMRFFKRYFITGLLIWLPLVTTVWVLLMLVTAISALCIRDYQLPNLAGYTPIHLLVPLLFAGLLVAFGRLARRDIAGHRRAMRITYMGACLVAGAFTLLPNRYLGGLLWHGLLGL